MSFPKNYPWYGYYKSSSITIIIRFDYLVKVDKRGLTTACATVLYVDSDPNEVVFFRKNDVAHFDENQFVPIKESEVNVIIRENKLSKII